MNRIKRFAAATSMAVAVGGMGLTGTAAASTMHHPVPTPSYTQEMHNPGQDMHGHKPPAHKPRLVCVQKWEWNGPSAGLHYGGFSYGWHDGSHGWMAEHGWWRGWGYGWSMVKHCMPRR